MLYPYWLGRRWQGSGKSSSSLRSFTAPDSPIATDDPSFDPTTMRTEAIYSLIAPKADATDPAGKWQELDITLLGRRVTVVVNGEVVVKNRKIPGITGGAIDSNEAMPGPILLQGSETAVEYHNIVLTLAVPIN